MRLTSTVAYQAQIADRRPANAETAAAVREANAGNSTADHRRNGEQAAGDSLTAQDHAVVAKLRARDAEVRAHEAAHASAGAGLAGAAAYAYQQGPDGRQYAIGGEVPIDMSEGATPDETMRRMRQVRAAALAPADPSSQDRAVAAAASAREAEARAEAANQADDHHHDGQTCPQCAAKVRRYAANLPSHGASDTATS